MAATGGVVKEGKRNDYSDFMCVRAGVSVSVGVCAEVWGFGESKAACQQLDFVSGFTGRASMSG